MRRGFGLRRRRLCRGPMHSGVQRYSTVSKRVPMRWGGGLCSNPGAVGWSVFKRGVDGRSHTVPCLYLLLPVGDWAERPTIVDMQPEHTLLKRVWADFWFFLTNYKAWWLTPILVILSALALIAAFGEETGVVPFIYR